jgi:hypothetical protein
MGTAGLKPLNASFEIVHVSLDSRQTILEALHFGTHGVHFIGQAFDQLRDVLLVCGLVFIAAPL